MRDIVQCNLLEIHKALQHMKDSEKACSKDACEIPFNSVFPKLTWLWKVFLPPTYQLTFQKTQPGKIYLINLAKKKTNKKTNQQIKTPNDPWKRQPVALTFAEKRPLPYPHLPSLPNHCYSSEPAALRTSKESNLILLCDELFLWEARLFWGWQRWIHPTECPR